jgi:hypothetical protein
MVMGGAAQVDEAIGRLQPDLKSRSRPKGEGDFFTPDELQNKKHCVNMADPAANIRPTYCIS